ncbi:MAG: hypothetical protein IT385_23630 [Deltaproteobacteria bacterium]|nr:hypothetical protein [Deltaproteobacteria bacterium]
MSQDLIDGSGCDDGILCTAIDSCSNGACIGSGLPDDHEDWIRVEADASARHLTGPYRLMRDEDGGLRTLRGSAPGPVTLVETVSGDPIELAGDGEASGVFTLRYREDGLLEEARSVLRGPARSAMDVFWLDADGTMGIAATLSGAVRLGTDELGHIVDSGVVDPPHKVIALLEPTGAHRWHRVVATTSAQEIDHIGLVPVQSGIMAGLVHPGDTRVIGANGQVDVPLPDTAVGYALTLVRFDENGVMLGAAVAAELPGGNAREVVLERLADDSVGVGLQPEGDFTFGAPGAIKALTRTGVADATVVGNLNHLGVPRWVAELDGVVRGSMYLSASSAGGILLRVRATNPALRVDGRDIAVDSPPIVDGEASVIVELDAQGALRWSLSTEAEVGAMLARGDQVIVAMTTRGDVALEPGSELRTDLPDDDVSLLIAAYSGGTLQWYERFAYVPYAWFRGGGETTVRVSALLSAPGGVGVVAQGRSFGSLTAGLGVTVERTGGVRFLTLLNSLGGASCGSFSF